HAELAHKRSDRNRMVRSRRQPRLKINPAFPTRPPTQQSDKDGNRARKYPSSLGKNSIVEFFPLAKFAAILLTARWCPTRSLVRLARWRTTHRTTRRAQRFPPSSQPLTASVRSCPDSGSASSNCSRLRTWRKRPLGFRVSC